KPANDERGEEHQSGIERLGVVDADRDGLAPPSFAVEDGELVVAVDECVALAPGAGRLQAELAFRPNHETAAAQPVLFEGTDWRAVGVAGFDATPPEPTSYQSPALLAGLGCRRTREQPVETDCSDASNLVEPAFAWRPLEHEVDHVTTACHRGPTKETHACEQPRRQGSGAHRLA